MSHPDDYIGRHVPQTWRGWLAFIVACAITSGGIAWKLSHDAADDPTPVRYCYDVPRDQYDGGQPDCEEKR